MNLLRQCTGLLITVLFFVVTAVAFIFVVPLAILKWAIPSAQSQARCNRYLNNIAMAWIDANTMHQRLLLPTQLHVDGLTGLQSNEWYMMIANHQSWVDVLILMRIFNRRIPCVKFFLKQSLIWVPLLGLCWWALDFPFMRRYSKSEIQRNPALKGKDIEETRKSCEKFLHNPVTIINFVEGTRFTIEKHQQQKSIYRHLLMPKAGGLSFTLSAMNGQLHCLLDVTIFYPGGRPSYWEYVCGDVGIIDIHICPRSIPAEMLGDYSEDAIFREKFQAWVNDMWVAKDEQLNEMRIKYKK